MPAAAVTGETIAESSVVECNTNEHVIANETVLPHEHSAKGDSDKGMAKGAEPLFKDSNLPIHTANEGMPMYAGVSYCKDHNVAATEMGQSIVACSL